MPVIEVFRSGYYQWVAAGFPKHQDKDAVVLAKIKQIERDNEHNYGVQRIYESLNKEHDIKCGRSKVQRIMHQNGIKARIKSKYKPQTTKVNLNEQAFPNLLNQQFAITKFNSVWLADITYIRTNGKWSYLAAVMDLARRKTVGWALGTKPNANLVCQALTSAIHKERPAPGLIHHSGRGSQYTSKAFRQLLEQYRITGRMSRKGNPYDNAPMGSFLQTLKTEYIYKRYFQCREQVTMGLKQWIDFYYNCRRLYSALGYKSPLFYEILRMHPFKVSA